MPMINNLEYIKIKFSDSPQCQRLNLKIDILS